MDSDGDDDEDGMDSHGDDEDSGGFLPLQDVLGGVQSLEIYDATLGDLSVLFLAKCLRFNTVLRSVNLGYNNIGAQGASALAAVLKEMKISELNLEGNSIGGYYDDEDEFVSTTEGITALCEGLKKSSVTSLNLRYNEIGPKEGAALAEGLKGNSTLQSLVLRNNPIRDQGVSALA